MSQRARSKQDADQWELRRRSTDVSSDDAAHSRLGILPATAHFNRLSTLSVPALLAPAKPPLTSAPPVLFQSLPHRAHFTHRQPLYTTRGHSLHTLHSHTTTATAAAAATTTAAATASAHVMKSRRLAFMGGSWRCTLPSSTPLPNSPPLRAPVARLHAPKDEPFASLACMRSFVFMHARVIAVSIKSLTVRPCDSVRGV